MTFANYNISVVTIPDEFRLQIKLSLVFWELHEGCYYVARH
jgi:hypothetical protein